MNVNIFKRFNCFKEDKNECGFMNIFVDPLLFLQFLRELCNGVFYNRLSNATGTAKLNINLMAGVYIITSSFNGGNIANRVTVTP